ncbi:hypothetical protein EV356DRAFT_536431 [Viridothelium virens]|uniref:F-box domain-containing protein n=1 Tax=Viridothelium virens TaxID=1048519 RepID=A0A6A6GXB3_VIRVR|nr:hypothetical protein EV356DRAFT_536431 [Viridothelium virens]
MAIKSSRMRGIKLPFDSSIRFSLLRNALRAPLAHDLKQSLSSTISSRFLMPSLLDIPAELRLEIFSYVLSNDRQVQLRLPRSELNSVFDHCALFHVCKTIRQEARDVFFQMAEIICFDLSDLGRFPDIRSVRRLLFSRYPYTLWRLTKRWAPQLLFHHDDVLRWLASFENLRAVTIHGQMREEGVSLLKETLAEAGISANVLAPVGAYTPVITLYEVDEQ